MLPNSNNILEVVRAQDPDGSSLPYNGRNSSRNQGDELPWHSLLCPFEFFDFSDSLRLKTGDEFRSIVKLVEKEMKTGLTGKISELSTSGH